MSTAPASLRSLIDRQVPVVAPLALDALAAKTAERAGFEALYVGGGALGYVKTFTEANLTLDQLCQVAQDINAASRLPLILDGTCGWGDPMHIHRTMAVAEAAGFSAIEIEDQLLPKRAHHHIDIEHLIPTELMAAKIREAVSARRDPDFVVIARTNACRTDGVEAAVERAYAFHEAGADMLLVLQKKPEQAIEVAERLAPLNAKLVYMTGRGITEMPFSLQGAGDLGFRLVIDATTPLFARQRALRQCYDAIMRGEPDPTFLADYSGEYGDIHELVGLQSMLEIEKRTVER